MSKSRLEAFAMEAAKGDKTPEDLNEFSQMFKKVTLEAVLNAEISPTLVSRVTNAVIEQVIEWQSRPLDAVYPIVYFDCIVVKIRQDKRVINKSIFLALGINTEGHKALMSMWIAENEGAVFWLNILTQLQQRGVDDILIACVDASRAFLMRLTLCSRELASSSVSYTWFATR